MKCDRKGREREGRGHGWILRQLLNQVTAVSPHPTWRSYPVSYRGTHLREPGEPGSEMLSLILERRETTQFGLKTEHWENIFSQHCLFCGIA